MAIARLMANEDARIWILDEPTASLDPLSEIEVYNLTMNVAQEDTLRDITLTVRPRQGIIRGVY